MKCTHEKERYGYCDVPPLRDAWHFREIPPRIAWWRRKIWGRILTGYKPFLSIEITRECPLRCPGCYAYEPQHLRGVPLRQLSDYRKDDLVRRVLALVDELRPLHVSIVGGDPLVRFRELQEILPALSRRGIAVFVVTSAFRKIPDEWFSLPGLDIVVSIDGLQPEHDVRRKPATYDLKRGEYG